MSPVWPGDEKTMKAVDVLLEKEGIRRDRNLDYTCVLTGDDGSAVATGSCFGETLRCFAVDHAHRGEGLLNQVVTHLIQYEAERGKFHLFLYTKPASAPFFRDLGFFEIARVPDRLVFMENRRNGFASYLAGLQRDTERFGGEPGPVQGALVMNANPFTLGHRYLAETAALACARLHLFVVREELSLIPYAVRRRLVEEGTADLPGCCIHSSVPYMISSATFPSYFLKDEETVIETQAMLDLQVFAKIAESLSVTERFVGEEPFSLVTSLYNRVMAEQLPKAGIACRVVPRLERDGVPVSASAARTALQQGDMETFRSLVPETTAKWFASPEAQPVSERIRKAGDVRHY